MKTSCRGEGEQAFEEGKAIEANPYHNRREYFQWSMWAQGWLYAEYKRRHLSKVTAD